ncbi:MAG: alpha/beta hydrolase [Chloroflexota bacterium]
MQQEGLTGPVSVSIPNGYIHLAGHLYLPEGESDNSKSPGVAVCHGLGSQKENHADFARLLQARGFAVLTFDLRGHGESEGELDDGVTSDLPAAVEYLAGRPEVDPSRIAVRGSSLGGQMAIHAGATSDLVHAVVAICPAHESLRLEWEKDPAFEAAVRDLANRIRLNRQGFTRHLQRHDVMDSVKRIAPRPLLLVHCRGDETIPYQLSEKLLDAAGESGELWLLEGGSHKSAQHDPEVQMQVADWIELKLNR